ncbi:MAG: DUF411 domain-containing protein [Wenzhouxiangella sp.]
MTTHTITNLAAIILAALLLAACAPPDDEAANTAGAAATEKAAGVEAEQPVVDETMTVYKTPWCGCCTLWAEQAIEAGFDVEMHDVESLHPIKEALGVPVAMGSCHTAKIAGYFIEGHVPFDDIHRLLAQRPDARGLTVPGMPIGSPGMEQGDRRQAYDVHLIDNQGNASVYNHYPAR